MSEPEASKQPSLPGSATKVLRLRCPHCGSPVEVVVDDPLVDIECLSCGSHFSLVDPQSTVGYRPGGQDTIGRFKLIEQVGVGRSGSVWKAYDPELDRTVAVKIPRRGHLDPAEIDHFLREARSAAQIRHPNIVSVHEVGREGDCAYIVTDFIEGASLREWLTGRQLTPREAATLCTKLADALHAAHEAGVIHRDLKPANIMLDASGEPRIADFGLAKRESGEITMTLDGNILGTPAYMPPEQARGEAHRADRRADIYSLGVILYELLCGELPFRGEQRMLILQILHDDPPSPRKFNYRVPRDLETISLKCLEKDPSRRYQTAQELGDELRRYLSGEPIRARPVSRAARVWRWCRRNPVEASLAGLVVLSLVTGTAVSTWFSIEARRQAVVAGQNAVRADAKAHEAAENLAQAKKSHQTTRQYLYAAQMNLVLDHWGKKDIASVVSLLETLRPGSGEDDLRGFEWYYYWRLTHGYRLSIGDRNTPCRSVAFLEGGKVIATGGWGKVTLWDAKAGEKKATVSGEARIYYWISATRKNEFLAHAFEPTFTVWKMQDGRLRKVYETLKPPPAQYAAFSPDGQLAAVSYGERIADMLAVVDLTTGKEQFRQRHPKGQIIPLAFSPDGTTLATGSGFGWESGEVAIWDAKTGKSRGVLGGHSVPIYDGTFSRDGTILATASADGVKLWDAQRRTLMRVLVHSVRRRSSALASSFVAFSPNGSILADVGPDHSLNLWDVRTGRELAELWGHTEGIWSAQFSPDGKTIATASEDNTVKLWDVSISGTVGDRGASLEGTRKVGAVWSVACSPDGKMIASATYDGTARLSNLADGSLRARLEGHKEAICTIAFAQKGKTAITGSYDGTIKVWNAVTGHQQRTLAAQAPVTAVAVSPQGTTVAAAVEGKRILLWNLETGKSQALQAESPAPSYSDALAFSPDGETVAAGCRDGTVRLFDARSGKHRPTHGTHEERVNGIAFSPDGTLLASAGADRVVILWDARTGEPRARLPGHPSTQRSVAFSPDGKALLSCGGDDFSRGTLAVWDLTRPNAQLGPHRTVSGLKSAITSIAYTPDGRRVIAGTELGTIGIWDATVWRLMSTFSGHAKAILSVGFSPDGNTLAFGKADFTADVIDSHTEALKAHLSGHAEGVRCLAFSPDRRTLATGSWDSTIKLWDIGTGREKCTLQAHAGGVLSLALSPDGRTLGSGGEDRAARLWDVATGGQRVALVGHKQWVWSVAFSPDGRRLATAGGNIWFPHLTGELKLWDPQTGLFQRDLSLGTARVHSAAFAGHGRLLLANGIRQKVRLWDLAERRGAEIDTPRRDANMAGLLAVSSDDRTLAIADSDHAIQLWDLRTGRQRSALKGHTGEITCMAFSPDGTILASGDENGSLRLWRTASKTEADDPARQPLRTAKAFTTSPDYELARFRGRLAEALVQEGQFSEADNAYRRSIEVYDRLATADSRDTRFRQELRLLAMRMAQSHLAVAGAMAESGMGKEAAAMYQKGVVYLNEAPKDALKESDAFDSTVGSERDRALIYNSLAWFLATCSLAEPRCYGQAVQLAEKAVATSPSDAAVWNTLGVAYYRAAQWAKAVQTLEKGVSLGRGGDSFDWFFLAMAHWQLGHKDQSQKYFDQAVAWRDANRPKDAELLRFRDEAARLLGRDALKLPEGKKSTPR